jgi:hypothetical protein
MRRAYILGQMPGRCREMKRLYVSSRGQGLGLGRALIGAYRISRDAAGHLACYSPGDCAL